MGLPIAGPPKPQGPVLTPEQKATWDKLVQENDLVLFMKGSPDAPRCGFSARAADVLKRLDKPFAHVDVFAEKDPFKTIFALREWADFPTLPQVWVKGELIGGGDIALELFESGELQKLAA